MAEYIMAQANGIRAAGTGDANAFSFIFAKIDIFPRHADSIAYFLLFRKGFALLFRGFRRNLPLFFLHAA